MYHLRIFTLTICCTLFTVLSYAQSYRTAAGFRFSEGADLTIQQYLTRGLTLEGIVHTGIFSENIGATLLLEKHHKLLFRNFNFYYGGGLHVMSEADGRRDLLATNVVGAAGIFGAEASFGRLNFAVDWKPQVNFAGENIKSVDWNGPAVSVRYIFLKRERKKLRDWKGFDRIKRS
jgi:hypothetical protein